MILCVCVHKCVPHLLGCEWHLTARGVLWEPRGGERRPGLWVSVQGDRLGDVGPLAHREELLRQGGMCAPVCVCLSVSRRSISMEATT